MIVGKFYAYYFRSEIINQFNCWFTIGIYDEINNPFRKKNSGNRNISVIALYLPLFP